MPQDENENARPQPEPRASEDSRYHSGDAITGFVAATRSQDALELIQANPLAYILATVIALRARWSDTFNRHGLQPGEAFLGDYESYGMTRQQYRTSVTQLQEWGFATFKATNKGTVGKLVDARLYDVFLSTRNQRRNQQLTNEQPASNQQLTTNEDRKDRKERKERRPAPEALVPDVLLTPEFRKAWDDWLSYRRQSGKRLTPQTQFRQLEKLAAMGVENAVKSIEQSICKGWQGLFEVKPTYDHTNDQQRNQQNTRNAQIIGGDDAEWERTLRAAEAQGRVTSA